jgi:hypothetical protein
LQSLRSDGRSEASGLCHASRPTSTCCTASHTQRKQLLQIDSSTATCVPLPEGIRGRARPHQFLRLLKLSSMCQEQPFKLRDFHSTHLYLLLPLSSPSRGGQTRRKELVNTTHLREHLSPSLRG